MMMNETTSLFEQREELKNQLAPGEYNPKLWRWVDKTGQLVQKLFKLEEPPPYWVNAAVLAMGPVLFGMGISLLLGEFQYVSRQKYILLEFYSGISMFLTLILHRMIFATILQVQGEYILERMTSITDLSYTRQWLNSLNSRKILYFGLLYSLYMTGNGLYRVIEPRLGLISPGIIISSLVGFLVWGMAIYYLILILVWANNLGRYQLKLYTANPSNSEIIHRLSRMIWKILYLFTPLGIISSAFLPVVATTTQFEFVTTIIISWMPIIGFFVIGQNSLSRIISNAKWRELNRIQAQVERLRSEGNIEEKETMETIKRLTEYHSQILRTPNSAINIQASLNFVTSLLLPIVAFVLTNVEKVLAFF